jgi:hypothetical protein
VHHLYVYGYTTYALAVISTRRIGLPGTPYDCDFEKHLSQSLDCDSSGLHPPLHHYGVYATIRSVGNRVHTLQRSMYLAGLWGNALGVPRQGDKPGAVRFLALHYFGWRYSQTFKLRLLLH